MTTMRMGSYREDDIEDEAVSDKEWTNSREGHLGGDERGQHSNKEGKRDEEGSNNDDETQYSGETLSIALSSQALTLS